ncbi:MAG: DUF5662 family protein [Candidatus Bathyarchaeia archaeon]
MRYLLLTLKHKWFVFRAGLKVGTPIWRLIAHDWTKLLPLELFAYNRQFFGKNKKPQQFMRAWLHHQNSNDHHWEYWIPRTGHNRCEVPYPDNMAMEMSEGAIMEMVADWLGAARAYTGKWPMPGEKWEWWDANWDKVRARLHVKTKDRIVDIMEGMGWTGLRPVININ